MIKRFFSLGLTIILAVGAWADDVQYKETNNWFFTFSDATKTALANEVRWSLKSNVYTYGLSLNAEQILYGETNLFDGLTFTATDPRRFGFNDTNGMSIEATSNTLLITLPSLSKGNVIEVVSTAVSGQYLTPSETDETIIKAVEGSAPNANTSVEQTYKYEILANEGGIFSLKPSMNAKNNTGKFSSVKSIKVYTSTTDERIINNWDFTSISSLTSASNIGTPTWTYQGSTGYTLNNLSTTGLALKIPHDTGTEIVEVQGLKFATSGDKTDLRVNVADNNLYIPKNRSAVITIPISKKNSKVTLVTNAASAIVVNTESDVVSSSTDNSGKTYIFNLAENINSFSITAGSSSTATSISSIKIEAPYAIVNGGSPEHGSFAFTSEGNEVENVENGFYTGSTVTINATPDAGYELALLTGTYYQDADHKAAALTIENNTFTMPSTGDVTITASFKKIQYKLTKSVSNGSLTLKYTNEEGEEINTGDSGIDLDWGTTIYVSASPSSEDYYLSSLTYGETALENNSTFSMPSSATEVTATFTAKNTPAVTKVADFTYDGQSHNLVTATAYDATLSYSYKVGDGDFSEWSGTIPSATNVGTYTVKWKATGGTQSKSVEETTLDAVIVSKATPTITTAPTASAITVGQTLASSTLSGGEASVEGSFAWTNSTIIPAVSDSQTTDYEVTFTPTDNNNYNTVTTNVKLTVNEPTPVNHMLTLQQPATGGSITADNSGELAAETEIKLTATPNAGYQLKSWKSGKSGDETYGSLPKSLIQTISMPNSDLTITAEFEAQPATAPSITEETLWTFEGFGKGTILSGTKSYVYNGLYINGHNDDTSNQAKIDGGSSEVETGISANVTKYLEIAGAGSATSSSSLTSFNKDAVGFYAGVPGTLKVYIKGVADDRGLKFYSSGNASASTTANTTNGTNQLFEHVITAAGSVYILSTKGKMDIYAIKFVPTPTPTSYDITVTQPAGGTVRVKVGDAEVTTANTTATAGQTITLTNTPAENYIFTSYSVTKTVGGEAVTVTDGSFTMPSEAVTVTAEFESTAHAHDYNYAVGTGDNTNILTATCQNAGCSLTENKATLILTATGGTYNGSPFGASTDLETFNTATGLSATVSINYTGDNSYNSADAPTNAGNYTATATVTIGETNYTLNKSFTIAKASITELTITGLDAPVGGMALDTEVACSSTGIESVSVVWKNGETDATGNAEASTVYTAIVTLTASSNYVFAESPAVNAISDQAGAVKRNGDTQISVAYTFDATEADDPVTHVLTVNVDDASHGSVAITVNGSAANSGDAVAEGASVSVTATANSGYTFKNWGNTEQNSNPYEFTMGTSDVTLTATFEEDSPAAEEYVGSATTWTFNSQTPGEITNRAIINKLYARVVSSRSYTFEALGTAQSLTFSDGASTTVSVEKVAKGTGTISYGTKIKTANDSPSGSSNDMTPSFAFNTTLAGTCYVYLQEVGDTHNDNYRQRIYFGDGTSAIVSKVSSEGAKSLGIEEIKWTSENAGTFVIGSTTALSKIYAIRFAPTRTVSKGSMTNGDVSIDKTTAEEGQTITLTITPNEGYELDALTVKDAGDNIISFNEVTAGMKYTFTMPDANVTATATFKESTSTSYTITLPNDVNGNYVTASVPAATAGTEITLTIITAENYTLASISADNNVELSESDNTRTFTMPEANVTITATWTIKQTDTGDSNTSETYTVTETGGIEVSTVTTSTSSSSITIPAQVGSTDVTSIANDAFNSISESDKSEIKYIDLSATSITGVEVNRSNGVFNGFPEETMIYMPASNTAALGQKNVVIGGTCSDFEMKNEKSYNIPTSFTATNAMLSRSFTSNVYCTLCLPYAIPAGNLGGKIYEFTSIEETTVQMTEDTNGLDANKPYIFVPSAASEGISASNVEVNMSSTPNTENNTSNFTFKGVYEHKEFTSTEISSGVYGFAADTKHGASSVGQFVKAANGAWIEGMRAYLAYSGSLSETGVATTRGEGLPDVLNVVLIHANGSTTNIGRLELMTAEDGSPVYNLNGQRVDNSYKGLVIKNGKKVVKK